MKKGIFFIISILVGISLFIGVFLHIGIAEIWQTIIDFSFVKWFLILALYFISFFVTLYRWQLILRSQGFPVKMKQIFPAKIVGFSVDYLTPSPNVGGEAIRAMVLKKSTGISMSQGLASIVIDKIMDFSYALPFLLFSIIYVLIKFDLTWKLVSGLLIVSLTFIFLIIFFYFRTLKHQDFFGSIIRFLRLDRLKLMQKAILVIKEFELVIIDFFHKDKNTLFKGLALSVIGGATTLFSMWLIIYFLGFTISFLDIILISTLTVITFLLPIPGSFGSTETGEALVFNLLGLPAGKGVAFSLVFRSIDLIKALIGIFYLSNFGFKIGQTLFKKTSVEPNNNNSQQI